MTTPLAFFVEGQPKGQPRPKAVNRGRHAGVYDPGTADGWKSCVRDTARGYRSDEPIATPMSVSLRFVMPRPKTKFRKRDGDGRQPHTSTPDADNLAKAVLDALTDIGFLSDDALVWSLSIEKWYAGVGERTGCHITVEAA